MLTESLSITYVLTSDDETDPNYVIITYAIRSQAWCDLRISRSRYAGFKMVDLIEQFTYH